MDKIIAKKESRRVAEGRTIEEFKEKTKMGSYHTMPFFEFALHYILSLLEKKKIKREKSEKHNKGGIVFGSWLIAHLNSKEKK